uniref:Uncharacterized protein n=1 Tax=Triticum urartu TaxID=4572 RepID=A0A8R7TD07_TRIUA
MRPPQARPGRGERSSLHLRHPPQLPRLPRHAAPGPRRLLRRRRPHQPPPRRAPAQHRRPPPRQGRRAHRRALLPLARALAFHAPRPRRLLPPPQRPGLPPHPGQLAGRHGRRLRHPRGAPGALPLHPPRLHSERVPEPEPARALAPAPRRQGRPGPRPRQPPVAARRAPPAHDLRHHHPHPPLRRPVEAAGHGRPARRLLPPPPRARPLLRRNGAGRGGLPRRQEPRPGGPQHPGLHQWAAPPPPQPEPTLPADQLLENGAHRRGEGSVPRAAHPFWIWQNRWRLVQQTQDWRCPQAARFWILGSRPGPADPRHHHHARDSKHKYHDEKRQDFELECVFRSSQ